MNTNLKHKCLFCSSPCEITLAFSSEGCSNPQCQAYKAPPAAERDPRQDFNTKTQQEAAAMMAAAPGECEFCWNGQLLGNGNGKYPTCPECSRTLNMSGMKTGRFSSNQPNFNNVPRVGPEEKRKVINAVALATGRFAPDSSGSISKELMDRFLASPDIYTEIAAEMYKVPVGEVTSPMRNVVKQRAFATLYGRDASMMKEYAKKDAELTAEVRRQQRLAECETTERDTLRWPNTMRVVRGPRPKNPHDKKGMRLAGVLSLVNVPYDNKGALAIYDYVSVELPDAGRCRFRVRRIEGASGFKESRRRSREGKKYVVALSFCADADLEKFMNNHIDDVLAEFENIDDLTHVSRKPTDAEMALFAQRRRQVGVAALP